MSWLVVIAAALPLGALVGRWWIVVALPSALVVLVTGLALRENLEDPCTRADGCGAGPVAGAFVVSVAWALAVAALLAAGVRLRRRARSGRAARPPRSS